MNNDIKQIGNDFVVKPSFMPKEVNSKAMQYLREFIIKMNTQDNRCTATPFYYTIRSSRYAPCYDGCGDSYIVVSKHCSETYWRGESLSDIVYEMIEGEYISHDDIDSVDLDCDIEANLFLEGEYYIYPEVKEWEERGVFFTETDAENHLKANYYHYSSDAHTYVKHAWRAPELEQFFKSVGHVCGVEYETK